MSILNVDKRKYRSQCHAHTSDHNISYPQELISPSKPACCRDDEWFRAVEHVDWIVVINAELVLACRQSAMIHLIRMVAIEESIELSERRQRCCTHPYDEVDVLKAVVIGMICVQLPNVFRPIWRLRCALKRWTTDESQMNCVLFLTLNASDKFWPGSTVGFLNFTSRSISQITPSVVKGTGKLFESLISNVSLNIELAIAPQLKRGCYSHSYL